MVLTLFSILVFSCEKKELLKVADSKINENSTEIEILENSSGLKAYKRTIEVVSSDGLLKYSILVGCFNKDLFEKSRETIIKLVKISDLQTSVLSQSVNSEDKQVNSDRIKEPTLQERLLYQILEISNKKIASNYTLSFTPPKNSQKLRVRDTQGIQYLSNYNEISETL